MVRLRGVAVVLAMLGSAAVVSPVPAVAQEPLPPGGVAGVAVPELAWTDCGEGFQCATAAVPLDYDEPTGPGVDLALIRLPASDPQQRIGSVFTNFGGPGGSGVTILRAVAQQAYTPELRARFDLVSFDPRGVGASTPVRCFDTVEEQQQALAASAGFLPVTAEQQAQRARADAAFAASCGQRAGQLLDHVSTADVARDLDVLRAAVGDARLNYIGYSYGTFLGSTYSALFGQRVGRMVADGVVDPEDYVSGPAGSTTFPRTGSDLGMSATFGEFLRLCSEAGPRCAFSAGDPAATFARIAERLRSGPVEVPVPGAEPVPVDYGTVVLATAGLLYAPAAWPLLGQFLEAVRAAIDGTPTPLPSFGPVPPPGYDNTVEAQRAVVCTDTDEPADPTAWPRYATERDAVAPYFGSHWTYLTSQCAYWPGKAQDRYTGPFTPAAEPPLIIGNRFDPATPYESAVELHEALPGSALLTLEGRGHTAAIVGSSCVDATVTRYLVDGQLPAPSATCAPDAAPFAPPTPTAEPMPRIGP